MDKSELTNDLRAPDEIRRACIEAAGQVQGDNEGMATAAMIVDAILTAIIAHSQSPRTVSELSLIRGPVQ